MSFWAGFEKEAALRHRIFNKLKGAMTGKEYLYHGTSKRRYDKILREGIKPNKKSSVTNLVNPDLVQKNKGIVFTSRDPGDARSYAKQQAALETLTKIKSLYRKHKGKLPVSLRSRIDRADPALKDVLSIHIARGLAPYHRGKVVRAAIPKGEVAKRKVMNPENQSLGAQIYGKQFTDAFKHDVPLRGTVNKRYLK